jgi:O-antigen ligase
MLRRPILSVVNQAEMRRPDGPTPGSGDPPSVPRWVPWLIAAVPVFPPLYVAAFGALGELKRAPLLIRWVLLLFAATQLLAALFTPRPLVSLVLAALRVLFILAMISAGYWLRDSARLRPLVWGYMVVFATAFTYTLATLGVAGVQGRMSHPYYYVVSLGLLAAICLWLLVSWRGASPWWRLAAGALALATLVASGSRGPLLAFVVGIVAAAVAGGRHFLRLLVPIVLLGVAALGLVPQLRSINPLERLATGGLTGRDQVWQNAFDAFQTSPIGGVGPYQLGPYLTFLYKDGCTLNPVLEQNGIHCPEWLRPLTGAWLIAHNAGLHVLAETGVIGLLGYAVVFLLAAWLVWRSRDALLSAIFWGYTAMNVVDVVIAVPSPHFSELGWVVIGMSFRALGVRQAAGEAASAPAGFEPAAPPSGAINTSEQAS